MGSLRSRIQPLKKDGKEAGGGCDGKESVPRALPFAGENLGPQESTHPMEAEEINSCPLERAFQIWPQAINNPKLPQSAGPKWAHLRIKTTRCSVVESLREAASGTLGA